MADFDAFDPVPQTEQQNEVDPAADFLAREQDELKGLEDDTFGNETNTDEQTGFDGFQQEAPDQPQLVDDFSGDFGGGEEQPQANDAYSAILQVDRQRAEPEKIRVWREENARRIEKKDEEEAERKEEWRKIAKKELEDWYKHHEEQLGKTKTANRESEAAFVADRDQTQPGEEWEKICRLCEFNPKNSKNTKDISRMRQILLQLKQTPLVR